MFAPPQLPAPLGELLAHVRALPTSGAIALTPADRAAWLVGLRQLVDATESAFTEVLAAFDTAGDGEALHAARSTGAWLQGACHLSPGDARERVRLARGLRDGTLREAFDGLADGTITYDQTRAVARAVAPLPPDQVPKAVCTLSALARQADAGQVRAAGRYLRNVVDPDGSRSAFEADFTRRFLTLAPLLDGMVSVDGVLDAEGAATLTAALIPFGVPSSPDDDRSAAQRRADGLVELARLALDHDRLPVSGGRRPHLEVLCALPAVVDPSLLASTGSPAPRPGRLPQTPGGPGTLLPIAVERLSCDATVTRVLIDAAGVPMDVGRAERVFPPALRRALALRDGGCRFPGCGFPAGWTDAHHLQPWGRGGSTSRSNGLLLCRFHHRKVHEGGWRVLATSASLGADGGLVFVGPDGQRLIGRGSRAGPAA